MTNKKTNKEDIIRQGKTPNGKEYYMDNKGDVYINNSAKNPTEFTSISLHELIKLLL